MRVNGFEDFGWALDDIMRDPVKEAKMLDISDAAYHHANIDFPTFVSPRLWSAVGGGTPRVGDPRLKDLTWMTSFALSCLTQISQEFRPFARVVKFRYGTNASRIHPELVMAAVVHRSVGGNRRLLLFLGDEL